MEPIPVKYKKVVRINNLRPTIKNGMKVAMDSVLDYEYKFLDNFNILDENKREYYYVINETATFQFDVAAKECIWFTITMCSKCNLRSFKERTPCPYSHLNRDVIHFCTEPNESINKFTITTQYSGTKFGLRFWYLSEIYTYSPAKYCGNDKVHALELDDTVSTSKTLFNLNKLENKCKHNCIICIRRICLEYRVSHFNYEYLYILILIPVLFLITVVFYRRKQKCKINLDPEIYYKFFTKNNSTNNDEQHLYEYVRHDNENDEDGYLKALTKDATDKESENSGKYYKFFRKNDSANNDRPHLYDYIRRHNENDEDGFESVNEVYKG
ncbi:uncharacterized protein LOC126265290 isoform X3 [Aethina tumida]|uniref:uncharacterized protein LOC126265290 isoform X3 n=1 Tax=Aethina tumida TaxID=116153 RepID=UPI002148EF5B|nr:uncharacterized protein LOC126265290 isoform X3 [Aethina tumida]